MTLLFALLLSACGGGGGDTTEATTDASAPPEGPITSEGQTPTESDSATGGFTPITRAC